MSDAHLVSDSFAKQDLIDGHEQYLNDPPEFTCRHACNMPLAKGRRSEITEILCNNAFLRDFSEKQPLVDVVDLSQSRHLQATQAPDCNR